MDYKQEVQQLNSTVEAFKSRLGQYKIKVLEEPQQTEYVAEDGKKTPQIKMKVVVEGGNYHKPTEKVWFVSKGTTTQSLYGQLMVLGEHHGKLENVELTLMVQEIGSGEKRRKSYMIPEVLNIQQNHQETVN